MLEVIFYQTTEDLIGTELSGNPLIICPSPLVADGLRRLMPENSEIITISKWISDYLKTKKLKRSNKADLMLRLSSVWRHYFPLEEGHLFFKSFEMFTDLRSFTLDLNLLSEFLKEVDEATTKSILLFWTFLQTEKLIDEHLSYQIFSEIGEEGLGRPVWIMGFKHLSGIQIDMLKVLGEKTEVSVFFPKKVYFETLSTDWIRWLEPSAQIDLTEKVQALKIIHFPKNKLNIVLGSIKKMIPDFDIALASQNITFNSRQEVAVEHLFFKSQEDLFNIARVDLLEELSEELSGELVNGNVELVSFFPRIEERKNRALKDEDFILYKVLLLFVDALTAYSEFQTTIDLFTLKVLKMILELNSPRVALATLTMDPKNRLLELNELPYRDDSQSLVIVASSLYGPLKSQESKYSEKMIEALRSIAPIKRAGLDFLYLKQELVQALSKEGSILLMEEGLEQIDLSWREILKGFALESVNPKADYKLKNKKDYLASRIVPGPHLIKSVSASRLQTYMDCPRKYYFSFVEKIDHRPVERLKIAPDEMGVIEHDIIEQYFALRLIDENLVFEPKFHEVLCTQALNEFLVKNKILLNEKIRLVTFFELLHYTQNGIEFLINFCRSNLAVKIEFERPLGENPWGLIGYIDCLVHLGDDKIAVFDFKRSGAAVGSKRETLAFDKIQIWVYLLILIKHQSKTIHSWGYLNLSEIEASQVYLEQEVSLLSETTLDNFQTLLNKTISELKTEVDFFPEPRKAKVCHFCEVELFCSKESCL